MYAEEPESTGPFDASVESIDPHELIKQLKQARAELQQRSHDDAMFRLLVASVKDYAIFMLDPSGKILSWNEGAQRIKGYEKSEIVGQHFSVFYPREMREIQHPQKELQIAEKVGRYEEEGWRVRKDGSLFWANVVITALRENGELVGFAKVTRDLTERRSAEQAREKAYQQATKANHELQQLAYVISHELQEPIASMKSYSNLLSSRYQGRLGSDADDFLDRIQSAARMTARLVDDLWTYARITKPGLEDAPISSLAAFSEAKQEISNLIEKHNAVMIAPKDDVFPTVEANREQFVYVIRELLTNAIKHCTTSGTPVIELSIERQDNGWKFSVADNGPGIDRFFAPQVFGIYQRLDGKPDEHGTGMGLPICKKIIEERHNGKIGFESIQGKGANFFVWLPECSKSI